MRWLWIALLLTTVPAAADDPPLRPALGEGDFLVQLGAEKSEAEAAHSWIAITAKTGHVLDGLVPKITPVALPHKGKLWRLRAGPVDPAGAASICAQLKAMNVDCIVVR